jgi:hypothetical protein
VSIDGPVVFDLFGIPPIQSVSFLLIGKLEIWLDGVFLDVVSFMHTDSNHHGQHRRDQYTLSRVGSDDCKSKKHTPLGTTHLSTGHYSVLCIMKVVIVFLISKR